MQGRTEGYTLTLATIQPHFKPRHGPGLPTQMTLAREYNKSNPLLNLQSTSKQKNCPRGNTKIKNATRQHSVQFQNDNTLISNAEVAYKTDVTWKASESIPQNWV